MLKPFVSISCALPLCAVFVFAMPAVLVSAEPATTSQVLVECRHTGGLKIEIDGRLDDAAWKLAQPLTNFTVLRSEGKQPAKHPTTARLLWDDEFLYIAFSCEADDIRTHIYNHDGPVWIAEAVESFLAPRGADAPYYEINYNPLNVVFDCRIEDWHMSEIGKHGMKWAAGFNPRVRSATWLDRDANGRIVGWSLEAAVPFADL
ncbi:MAG: carbohydrate-binding family 9-like protein, partial [Verrucomicrobia bacterium]|nr:carbohydrate-binding family 9-like protein [Verrucomicrobiota bacterium]